MPPTPAAPEPPAEPTGYFAFGSNLWLAQMRTRCPSARYLGVARLPAYTWLINERGYANVVESRTTAKETAEPTTTTTTNTAATATATANPNAEPTTNHVYGLIFTLTPSDETSLDAHEGVPTAYTKEHLPVDFWAASSADCRVDTTVPPTEAGGRMLVYVDRRRVVASTPRADYVYRINRGVEDAVRLGVPAAYVEGVVRRFVPAGEEGEEEGEESVEEAVKRQGAGIVDGEVGVDGRGRRGSGREVE
ncbi:hypothetical protein PMIN06_008045 [Paraphaeosphaeria minitans]|uniref:gamma-glutamylcyclotransferase n=1 Tax=Paraphaeosphaeria minitans TaxID=565426 RepID=A0A9P6KQ36_9PLEO|nr:AIG2 family protein [Paraphaeosphaeria minitans]